MDRRPLLFVLLVLALAPAAHAGSERGLGQRLRAEYARTFGCPRGEVVVTVLPGSRGSWGPATTGQRQLNFPTDDN